jgi:hypothetical protein
LGLALASGIRLYATVLTLGLGIRFGWLSGLPPELSALGLNSQGNGPAYWAIGGIGFLVTVLLILAGVGYTAYRAEWPRRVAAVWGKQTSSENQQRELKRKLWGN